MHILKLNQGQLILLEELLSNDIADKIKSKGDQSLPGGILAQVTMGIGLEDDDDEYDVVIEVSGGVASVEKCREGITVNIVDYDNEEEEE